MLDQENSEWPPKLIEFDTFPKLSALLDKIQNDRIVGKFTSVGDLAAEVSDALVQWEEAQGIKAKAVAD